MELPKFKYHPDPVKTGSFIKSDEICECCKEKKGYIYYGTLFADEDIEYLCPWCIKNGDAYKKFSVEFVDPNAIGDYGQLSQVSDEIKYELSHLTPSFYGWQEIRWWTHCNDASAFLGLFGKNELEALNDNALINQLKSEISLDDLTWTEYYDLLAVDDSPTAYVFQCIHCKKLAGYTDSN